MSLFPPVQWYEKKMVPPWLCSHRALWIIRSNQVMISGETWQLAVMSYVIWFHRIREKADASTADSSRTEHPRFIAQSNVEGCQNYKKTSFSLDTNARQLWDQHNWVSCANSLMSSEQMEIYGFVWSELITTNTEHQSNFLFKHLIYLMSAHLCRPPYGVTAGGDGVKAGPYRPDTHTLCPEERSAWALSQCREIHWWALMAVQPHTHTHTQN